MDKIDYKLYNIGRMGNWQERMETEARLRSLAKEEEKKRKGKIEEEALAQRKESHKKRAEKLRLYNVEQRLKEIKEQVWQLGDLHTEVSSSSDFKLDKVFSSLSFYLNFEVDAHEDLDMGGSGGMENYVPNYRRVDFRQQKIFFTGIKVDISSDALIVQEAAYVMTQNRTGSEFDMSIIIGRREGRIWNEFHLYGFEPEEVRIGLEQPNLDSALDSVLLESCLRRKEKGLAPISVARILGANHPTIKTGARKLLPPFIDGWSNY